MKITTTGIRLPAQEDYDKRVAQELHDLRELVNRLNGIIEQQRRDIEHLRGNVSPWMDNVIR